MCTPVISFIYGVKVIDCIVAMIVLMLHSIVLDRHNLTLQEWNLPVGKEQHLIFVGLRLSIHHIYVCMHNLCVCVLG